MTQSPQLETSLTSFTTWDVPGWGHHTISSPTLPVVCPLPTCEGDLGRTGAGDAGASV